jgi:hypothetical protein
VVEFQDNVHIPDGTQVDVVVDEALTPEGYRKGSPQALLAYLDRPPLCTPEDVDALMEEVRKARLPMTTAGIFDDEQVA